MNFSSLRRGLGILLCVIAVACCVIPLGCGSGARKAEEQMQSNLRPLAHFYNRYVQENRGRAPANEEEFKQFIRSRPSQDLADQGVTDVESLFVSSRDNKPYVVIYGGQAPSDVVAYEQEGVGGKRFVATNLGGVEELDEAGFSKRVPNAN
jgi:hypothetical protein